MITDHPFEQSRKLNYCEICGAMYQLHAEVTTVVNHVVTPGDEYSEFCQVCGVGVEYHGEYDPNAPATPGRPEVGA